MVFLPPTLYIISELVSYTKRSIIMYHIYSTLTGELTTENNFNQYRKDKDIGQEKYKEKRQDQLVIYAVTGGRRKILKFVQQYGERTARGN